MARLRTAQDGSRRSVLEPAIRGLSTGLGIAEDEIAQLLSDDCPLEWTAAGAPVPWGGVCPGPKLIVRGWACEARRLPDGRQLIYAFLLPGDVCYPLGPPSPARVAIRALTPMRTIALGALRERHRHHAFLDEVLRRASEVNLERRYDTALRLGQLTAAERIVDLLGDLRQRLAALGLADGDSFRLPLTQGQLADALGMSPVHLNRVLAELRRRGVLDVRAGQVRLVEPDPPSPNGSDQGSRRPSRPR
jgi:CRP-like cAMP-binding protein